jgi:hypothetical protein
MEEAEELLDEFDNVWTPQHLGHSKNSESRVEEITLYVWRIWNHEFGNRAVD